MHFYPRGFWQAVLLFLIGCADGSVVKQIRQPEKHVLIRPLGSGEAIELPSEILTQHAGSVLEPVYQLCIGLQPASRDGAPASGTVTTVRGIPGLPGADEVVAKTLGSWKWTLFSSRPLGQVGLTSVCWRQSLRFSIPARSEIIAGEAFKKQRSKGADPHLPSAVRLARAGETVNSVYRVCLDRESSRIKSIKPIVRIPGADGDIIEQLQSWAWRIELPADHPEPLCFNEAFQFVIEGEKDDEATWITDHIDAGSYELDILPALLSAQKKLSSAPSADAAQKPTILVKKQPLYTPNPHLPDWLKRHYRYDRVSGTYKICFGQDGTVRDVEPILPILGVTKQIVTTLSAWRFAPSPVPICFFQTLEFHVD